MLVTKTLNYSEGSSRRGRRELIRQARQEGKEERPQPRARRWLDARAGESEGSQDQGGCRDGRAWPVEEERTNAAYIGRGGIRCGPGRS